MNAHTHVVVIHHKMVTQIKQNCKEKGNVSAKINLFQHAM